ncbi:MAG: transglutaminase domain-containing protein [Blastocatellia bacterium]
MLIPKFSAVLLAIPTLLLFTGFLSSSCRSAVNQSKANMVLLTSGHLTHAAERAGFRVEETKAEIPRAVRSRIGFRTLDYNDPRLAYLREQYQLRKHIESAQDEWTAQLLLKQWVRQSISNGDPRVSANTASEILRYAAQGETFYCTHYTITYVESALALGWQARMVGVDRRHGPEGLESAHHGVAEVWSNQFSKWVVIDTQSNLHFEKDGIPLSAWEIRTEWLNNQGANVDHVVGVPPQTVKKNPAIIWWNRRDEDETAAFFWFYIEDDAGAGNWNNRLRYIFPQDQHNRDLIWYQNDPSGRGRLHEGYSDNRFIPTWSLEDAYWTVGIAEVRLAGVSAGTLQLSLDSYCPNQTGFEAAFDDRGWERMEGKTIVTWKLKDGANRLRLRTVSLGEVKGPEAMLFLRLKQP